MLILGILAATMVTTLKPAQYRNQAFNTIKKKVYMEVDNTLTTFQVECAKNMSLTTIYNNCDRMQNYTHEFGENTYQLQDAQLLANYMRGTVAAANTANGKCTIIKDHPSLKLRNGVCLYIVYKKISVDVNGNEGPNEIGIDRMRLDIDSKGITFDMDAAVAGTRNDGVPLNYWTGSVEDDNNG